MDDTHMSIEDGAGNTLFEGTADDLRDAGRRFKADKEFDDAAEKSYRVTADELRSFIERWERLDAERRDIVDEQKEVMSEARGRGYDVKIIKKVIARRKREPDDIAEEQAVLSLYLEALGMPQ